jgi:hypothetical protein
MDLVLAALAVYTVVRLLKLPIQAPPWVWMLVTVVVSAVVVLIPYNSGEKWYTSLAVTGAVYFLQHLEDYLIVKSDEALVAMRRRR